MSAVVVRRVWFRSGEMPHDVRFEIESIVALSNPEAVLGTMICDDTAQELFCPEIDVTLGSKKQPWLRLPDWLYWIGLFFRKAF